LLTASQESHENTIDLSADHEPRHIEALVESIYTSSYSSTGASLKADELMALDINLAILADKYNIEGLHETATDGLKAMLPEQARSLALAAKIAYAAPAATQEIREAISAAVMRHKEWLANEEGNVLVQTREEIRSFALDVARRIAITRQTLGVVAMKACPTCNQLQQFHLEVVEHLLYRCDKCDATRLGAYWRPLY
jgi:hypothetical protein